MVELPLHVGRRSRNFGSMDGDGLPLSVILRRVCLKSPLEMLRDLNKNTVDFQDNYDDGSEREPTVLPSRIPNLLVNGATGIAVGMATNIPPHNLAETIDAVKLMMDNPEVTTRELMEVLPGPGLSNWWLGHGGNLVFTVLMKLVRVLLFFVRVLKLKQPNQVVERIVVTEFLTWSIRPRSMNISFV